jgi:hypothetical protein
MNLLRDGDLIMTNRVSEHFQKVSSETGELVEQHPLSSLMVVFGAGIAAGLLIASCLPSAESQRQADLPHRLGRYMLDSMGSVLPDAWMKKFHG